MYFFQQQVGPSFFASVPVSVEHFCTKTIENRRVVQLAKHISKVTSYLS